MHNSKPGIDLLVPGLLGPMPALREIDITPQAPVVERCLARASVSEITPRYYPSTLFHLFGLSHAQSGDLPTAPYCRLADGGQDDDGYWLQASPVHLRPDGDGVLLFDAEHLDISLDEANQLAEMFRQHFSDRGWRLEVYSPQRWYLRLESQPDFTTSSLSDVTGRNIDGFLPMGGDATKWHSILNEVQMLFYTAQLNMLREGKGQLTINGLWLHGGGTHHPITDAAYAAVSGDEPLLRGMARAAGIEPAGLPQESAELVPVSGKCLVVAHLLERSVLDADPYGWVESLERIDAWLEPLLKAVGTKRLGHINLYPCNGSVYRIDAGGMRRFWRGRRPLSRYLS
jgi:hypothetical protein